MNGKVSRAREFFDQIKAAADPASFLSGMVAAKKTENDFLEFKGAGRISDQQAKEYWSQALSGFANTEGGVLVWGIRADKIADPADPSRKIDAASSLDLVPNQPSFLQLPKDVRLEATVDPVPGVDYAHYQHTPGDTAGFVVCLVPESGQKPHRAQLDPKRQYYQRIGDSFVILPHSLLRTLFYPRSQAVFRAMAKMSRNSDAGPAGPGTAVARVSCSVGLRNVGTATAYNVVVAVGPTLGGTLGQFKGMSPDWVVFFEPPDRELRSHRPMHPRKETQLFFAEWEGAQAGPGHVLSFYLTVFCDHHQPQFLKIEFDMDELVAHGRCVREATAVE
jgi:hypothetical protein